MKNRTGQVQLTITEQNKTRTRHDKRRRDVTRK